MHEQAYKDYPCLFGTQYIMGGKLCSKTRCCVKKIYKRLDRIIVCSSIREVQRRTRISKNTIAKYLARVEDNKKDQSLEIVRSKQIIILLIYT